MRELALALAVPLVLAAACAPSSGGDTLTVVRDSAGVRIVETRAESRFDAPWTVAPTADWNVGAVEGDRDYLLSRVVGAMTLRSGEILVANGGSNQLRFYDEAGRLTRSLGREGEGPGEFVYLRALGRCRPEGFVAFDLNWQVNAYSAGGDFLEKTVLQTPTGITPYNLACDRHGHFLMLGWGAETRQPHDGFYEAWDRLLLATEDGTVLHDFGEHLASERIGSRSGSGPHPAGRATKFALHEDVVYVGTGERFEVELRDLDGALRGLLRGPTLPLNVTDSLRAAYLEAALARARPERRPQVRQRVTEMPWPEGVPAYTDVRVDLEGVAWLKALDIGPRGSETWSLLDPERGYLGDVHLPPGMSLLEIGLEHVLVLARDELDVERVLRFRLYRDVP